MKYVETTFSLEDPLRVVEIDHDQRLPRNEERSFLASAHFNLVYTYIYENTQCPVPASRKNVGYGDAWLGFKL